MIDVSFADNVVSAKIPSSAPVGKFSLSLQFNSAGQHYNTENNFTLYNRSAITFQSLIPEEKEANSGPCNVTIKGDGFPDTGYTRCITDVGLTFPAKYINSTSIVCFLSNIKRSMKFKLVPQFGATDTHISPSSLSFTLFVMSPYPLSANFSQNLQMITLVMNAPAEYDSTSCAGLFTDVSKFGSYSVCTFNRPTLLIISLRGNPTIAPGDEVHFKDGTLKRRFEKYTKPMSPNNRTLVVNGPPKTVKPVAQMSGPNTVGTYWNDVQ